VETPINEPTDHVSRVVAAIGREDAERDRGRDGERETREHQQERRRESLDYLRRHGHVVVDTTPEVTLEDAEEVVPVPDV